MTMMGTPTLPFTTEGGAASVGRASMMLCHTKVQMSNGIAPVTAVRQPLRRYKLACLTSNNLVN